VSAPVRAGELRESEGVLFESPRPSAGPFQSHVPRRHRLLPSGRLRLRPAVPPRCQEPRTH
ncbi:Uncharacterized protein DAT39_012630, partial [Clarias magur]